MKTIYNKNLNMIAVCMLVITATLSACKHYLEVPPQGQITQSEIASDPNAAKNLVIGIYNVFYIGGFDPDIDSFQFVIMTDIASDDADKGSSPDDYGDALQIDNLTPSASNGVLNNVWAGHYQGIARANQALGQLQNAQFEAATKNALIGEARFLRALFYFNLVRLYGGVPLLDQVPPASEANQDKYQTRASSDDIYKFIIGDLDFAAANLPDKGATDVGRATKSAAQALEAKVYLYMQNYQKAYDLSKAVMDGGKYTLVKDYSLIWRQKAVNGDGGNNNSESIFEIQAGINKDCSSGINLYTVSQGPRAGGKFGWADLGFGFNNPSASLLAEYEANDVRKAATVITIQDHGTVLWDGFRIPSRDSVQNGTYSYKAYHSRTAEDNCGGNTDHLPKQVRVLRYADILLINAEAAFQIGRAGEATTDLNMVRTRAGLPASTASLLNIWHERRMELAEEHDRFFDIVRQDAVMPGRAATAFAAHGKTWSAKNALFPVPQTQIDLSGGRLKQNPGY
ncbi:RagB/SusD family nutrient uptake outer membrane protein [Mucilaginibacter aquaedulcis]|uniref:RagB/SusD family nutrient uptake outer membrane protein n=1 Tax=Mucilaginibacter aquaedulcis TaxID=1187081 RepID=UPI0025B33E73|nr:RagB/SusD family nutrient uptake outer membrane protein [Mucilaginibacter aquaedulcis]MDN3551397.1 RagB/SusD family nutrient uptake outer membrane protein [Mucilaginibacter aquaedulcis]